ncbi:hypothetical protein ACLEEB_14595 [Lonsdalea quercina]|uniref:hypothetical protein n=1 Tax=Lonsdalea quercina TaxID=71657 RepID=UPI0039769CBC
MQPSIIDLTTNLSAATLSINNVSEALGLSGDGAFSLQVITKFTDLQKDNETLRAMVQELTDQRDALDGIWRDLLSSIRRESAEREKNAKLLAWIAELEGDITQIMQNSWDEYCDDTGCCPDDFRIDQGTGYLEFESGAWATLVAKRLISKLSRISG